MNTLSKEHQLQKRISEILEPNLEDRLVFGCEIFDKRYKLNPVIFSHKETNKIFLLFNKGSYLTSEIDKLNVLGLPINLERLLLALRQIDRKYSYKSKYDFISKKVSHKTFIGFDWILTKSFKEQSQETQEALYKLFNL